MATYNYNNTITQVDNATINFELLNVVPPTTVVTSVTYSRFTNQITGVIANMAASFPSNPLPNSYNLTSTVAGMGSVFGDSVYRYESNWNYTNISPPVNDDYESDDYFLVCTAIDAAILALPSTTGMQIARKDFLVFLRNGIQNYFDAADYTNANLYIEYIGIALTELEAADYPLLANTFVLSATDDFTVSVGAYTPLGGAVVTQGGWYNIIINTLTEVEYPYTWDFNYTAGGSNVVSNTGDYPDGVYTNLSSQMWFGSQFGVKGVRNSSSTKYALVTTTIDNQIQLFEDNYDPDNTAEAIALADLQSLQTQIAAAYAAEDYDLTNELIAQAQAILANGLSREISAALTSDADMNVFFTVPPAMPVGTYTTSTSTITNTLTGVAFTFDGFPLSASDLTQLLNSETLGFGADFPDGTYQIVVPFYVDGLLFTAECYLVVTTDWQCCIDKAAGKKCGKLNTALMQANLTNAVRIVALYSDVNTANALISEGNRECSSCGCGCS